MAGLIKSLTDREYQKFVNVGGLPAVRTYETQQLTIANAIEETAFQLSSSAYAGTTSVSNDYILDSIELNFSSNEAKTITINSPDGTVLWGGNVDTSSLNKGYNTTSKHFNLVFNQAFSSDNNISVAVTQCTGSNLMDCIVKTKQGASSLGGNPVLANGTNTIGKVKITNGTSDLVLGADGMMLVQQEISKRIADSEQFYASHRFESVATDDTVLVLLKTGTMASHGFITVGTSGKCFLDLFENPTITDDGTPVNSFSLNRETPSSPVTEVFHTPTTTSEGTLLEYGMVGTAGKFTLAGGDQLGSHWWFKPNEEYLIKVINKSEETADFIVDYNWHEHEE